VLGPELAAYQPLLNKLLGKDPNQRFGNAREALEALEQTPVPVDESESAEPVPALAG
jgi:hypothetical protein